MDDKRKAEDMADDDPSLTDPEREPVMVEIPSIEDNAIETVGEERPKKVEVDKEEDDGAVLLKRRLEETEYALQIERQRTDEALRLAQDRDARAQQAYAVTEDAQYSNLQNGLQAAQSNRETARQKLKAAQEVGDYDAIADATEVLGRSSYEIKQYESSIAQFVEQVRQQEAWAQQQARQPRQQQPQRQLTVADINAMIDADPKLWPEEREWLKKHPDARATQQGMNRLQVAFDVATRVKRQPRGSDEYFETLDEIMGYQGDKEKSKPNPGARISAPVNRGKGGGGKLLVPVSKDEKDIAERLGMSVQEWAEHKARNAEDRKANPQNYTQNYSH